MSGPEIQANAIWTALRGLPLRDAPRWIGLLALLAARRAAAALAAPALARGSRPRSSRRSPARFSLASRSPRSAPAWIVTVGRPAARARRSARSARSPRVRSSPSAASAAASTAHNDVLEQRVRERTARAARDAARDRAAPRPGGRVARRRHRRAHPAHQPAVRAARARRSGCATREAELIRHASAMHDVGKIGIPDRVLLKPGRLDAEEWALMQTPHDDRRGDPRRLALAAAADRRGDRAHAPRALGRHRLPGRA